MTCFARMPLVLQEFDRSELSDTSTTKMSKLIFIFLLIIGVYYRGTSADLTDRLEANLAAERAKVIKEVADIKTRRRVYDVHYALYITSNRGVGKFIRTHFPPYEYHEGDEREPQVYKCMGCIFEVFRLHKRGVDKCIIHHDPEYLQVS
ncbi:hypothetical protein SeMB42_g07968 [Synchytrium endobioticum]|uniref:Uncharacterized protein n=1 Tax=Synchytrium endobioticum TaxID=286115 RepID=A0A507BW97_9FUNG|nr:hypothetical protein SeMB42_g07968 [Synchytrium endobioticum]